MSPEDEEAAERAFERDAAAELKRSIESMPAATRERLDHIVDRAVHEAPRSFGIRFGLPVGAAAAFIVYLVSQQSGPRVEPPAAAQSADDLALLLNVDSLDLLEQMEFYQWLDRQPGMLDQALTASSAPAQRS